MVSSSLQIRGSRKLRVDVFRIGWGLAKGRMYVHGGPERLTRVKCFRGAEWGAAFLSQGAGGVPARRALPSLGDCFAVVQARPWRLLIRGFVINQRDVHATDLRTEDSD